MPSATRPRSIRLGLESLEDRLMPALSVLGSLTLPGALAAWNYSTGPELNASPVMADLEGDGRQEVLAPGGDGNLYAYAYFNGGIALDRVFSTGGGTEIRSTPAVADVPGVGRAVFAAAKNGLVFGWNAKTGALLPGWPESVVPPASLGLFNGPLPDVYGAVVAADINGDGSPEILVTSLDHELSCFNARGGLLWRYNADDTIFGAPVVGDLNRDGRMEIVFGSDTSNNDFYNAGGQITALSDDGRRLWVKQVSQTVQSSPVLADISGNGTLDIFVGTGINYSGTGNKVYGLDPAGNDLPGWPLVISQPTPGVVDGSFASPVVGDINNGGRLEVVIGDATGNLRSVDPANGVLWTAAAFPGQNLFATPILADVNGDGIPDVIQASATVINAYSGGDGSQVLNQVESNNLRILNSPVVGHFRGDSSWQLAYVADGVSGSGALLSPSYLKVFDITPSPTSVPWSSMRQDAANDAVTRPDGFSTALVNSLYTNALGRAPAQSELDYWVGQLRHAPSLAPVIQALAGSNEARTQQITGWFVSYLGRSPSNTDVNSFLNILAQPKSYAYAQANIVGSQEAFNRAGGTNAAWVVYLYQKVLGRNPAGGEENYWINGLNAGTFNRPNVAFGFLLSKEYTQRVVAGDYSAYQPGGLATPPADSLQVAGFALRNHNFNANTEEQVLTSILVGNGDYVATDRIGSWLRAIYNDVLGRPISTPELVNWETGVEDQGFTFTTIAYGVVRSHEANDRLVAQYYAQYLRRASTAAERSGLVGLLDNGGRREVVLAQILGSNEYYVNFGRSDPNTYISQVFLDLTQTLPSDPVRSFYLSKPSVAALLGSLPYDVMTQVGNYAYYTIYGWYVDYLRRYPVTPSDSGSQNLGGGAPYHDATGGVNYILSGGSQIDIQVQVLASGEYVEIAWDKAFWTGQRWKR